MLAVIAGIVFAVAFGLSGTVIAYMFATYHDKIVAALLFEPIPGYASTVRTTEVRHGARP